MEEIKNILKKNEELNAEVGKHWQEESDLRKREIEAIHDMVKTMGGTIEVDIENDNYPVIAYDGGNHIEYASTLCACVSSVKSTEQNGIKLFSVAIDECDDYDSDRIGFSDIDQIYDYVCDKFEEYLDKQ